MFKSAPAVDKERNMVLVASVAKVPFEFPVVVVLEKRDDVQRMLMLFGLRIAALCSKREDSMVMNIYYAFF